MAGDTIHHKFRTAAMKNAGSLPFHRAGVLFLGLILIMPLLVMRRRQRARSWEQSKIYKGR